jgi:hypothetical protein
MSVIHTAEINSDQITIETSNKVVIVIGGEANAVEETEELLKEEV